MTRAVRDQTERPSAIRTFLIADIRGYTRFTNELGDEAGSRLAAKFAQVTAEGVEAYGGTLLELRGDEAMCVFESARGALRCAVELQDAFIDETRLEPHLPLQVGIGLDAGEAVPVGDGYRGAALNLAARLCSAAAAGLVIATDGLVHLAGHVEGLAFAALDERPLKGFDERVAAWSIGASTPHTHKRELEPSARNLEPLPPELDSIVPLVGREAELRWLRWHWRRARHGHGRVVALSGPPGMGRTRLTAELAVVAHGEGATVHYIRSLTAAGEIRPPAIVVIDDVDRFAPGSARELWRKLSTDTGHDLVVVTHAEPASDALARGIARLVPAERRRSLRPLSTQAVTEIARLYFERPGDEPPSHLLFEESDGVPLAVHRVASQWARAAATRRLGDSARRTSRERRNLRAAEEELIGDVATLELARERSRLYVEAPADLDVEASTAVCPYKGLAAFEAVDAEYYFGRERLVAELTARIVGSAFVGLVGASGSGKSSALQAGLLPELAHGVLPGSNEWIQVPMRPGEQPMRELYRTLVRAVPEHGAAADPHSALTSVLEEMRAAQRVLLVVDQFEELFTAEDEAERSAFVDLITEPRTGFKVLIAVRADQYERCAAYPRLARALGAEQVLVGPMTSAEIESIIRHPAERVGLRVEPDLVEALVSDVGTEPGGLPLLSTALLELWEARDGGRLSLSAYHATGGVRGAVARMAESGYQRLTEEERSAARGIFLRLAGEGDPGTVVRRRVRAEELGRAEHPSIAGALRALVDARLLSASDGYVEVAHEALLREWPRLRAWLDEDAAGRQLRLHLMSAARSWNDAHGSPDELYRGARLAATLEWAAEHEGELNTVESRFLSASRERADREAIEQRRINRQLRALLAGTGVLFLAATAAAVFAVAQLTRAEDEASRAEANANRAAAEAERAEEGEEAARRAEEIARSRELAASAIAVLDDDPRLSKLLALTAASIADPPIQSVSALHQALAADRTLARYRWPSDRDVFELWTDLHPSGELLVASGAGSAPASFLEVVEVPSGRVVWSWETPPEVVIASPSFSADGSRIYAATHWQPPVGATVSDRASSAEALGIFVWAAGTGEVLDHYDVGACGGRIDGISPARLLIRTIPSTPLGCFIDAAELPVAMELLDLESGERELIGVTAGPQVAALSGDGEVVAFRQADDVVVRRLASGEEVLLPTSDFDVNEQLDRFVRALSEDGSMLLYGGRPIMVWDVKATSVIAEFDEHAGESWLARFAPDGETVLSSGRDGTLRRWNAKTGEELMVVPAAGSGSISALPDGRVLVADPAARTALLVDTAARGELGVVETCPGFAIATALEAAEGYAIFTMLCDDNLNASTHVVDLQSFELAYVLPGSEGQSVAISPDGSRFVSQTGRGEMMGPIRVHDTQTGEEALSLEGLCEWNWRRAGEGVPRTDTGDCQPFPRIPFAMQVWQMEWSPDGSMIAAADHGGFGGFLVVWDAKTGRILNTQARDAGSGQDRGWGPNDLLFTDDSSALILTYGGTDARYAVSTETWDVIAEFTEAADVTDGFLGLAGFAANNDLIGIGSFAGQGAGAVHWLDASNLAVIEDRSLPAAHDGSIKDYALSDDRRLLATAGADGFVRVWDVVDRTIVHEIPIGDTQVQGVVFVDRNTLAVLPQPGTLRLVTIDTGNLLQIVRQSLTRGFTPTECGKFAFADDCPTLAELRDGK